MQGRGGTAAEDLLTDVVTIPLEIKSMVAVILAMKTG